MKKIVFIAIVARTGELTRDNRVLMAPEMGLSVAHRDYPLPVVRMGAAGVIEQIGTVDQVALCDRRLIAFGHLDPTMIDSGDVARIAAGYDHLALELDIEHAEPERDHDGFETLRVTGWIVRALRVIDGYDCAWVGMPSPQIEIMEVKETTDA